MPAYQPGDLIGFSSGDWLGVGINVSTLGWPLGPPCWRGLTHVGIVADIYFGVPMLWESTTLCEWPCAECGHSHSGLQSHVLQTRIRTYRGTVWRYPLHRPLDRLGKKLLRDHAAKYHGAAYDPFGAAGSRTLCLGWLLRQYASEELSALFCSEYAADALKVAEVWSPPNANASAWNPNRLARTLVATGIVAKPRRLK